MMSKTHLYGFNNMVIHKSVLSSKNPKDDMLESRLDDLMLE